MARKMILCLGLMVLMLSVAVSKSVRTSKDSQKKASALKDPKSAFCKYTRGASSNARTLMRRLKAFKVKEKQLPHAVKIALDSIELEKDALGNIFEIFKNYPKSAIQQHKKNLPRITKSLESINKYVPGLIKKLDIIVTANPTSSTRGLASPPDKDDVANILIKLYSVSSRIQHSLRKFKKQCRSRSKTSKKGRQQKRNRS